MSVLAVAASVAGCGPTKVPVIEGDSEAIIALKDAGADVQRLPSFGGVNPETQEMDYSNLPLTVDLNGVSVGPEIMELVNSVPSIKELTLRGSSIDDEVIFQLTGFKSLSILDLTGANVTDAGVKHLGESMLQITALNLSDTQVTGEGLAYLPQVSSLFLVNVSMGDEDLKHLERQKSLQFLSLIGTRVTPPGLAKFMKRRPNLLVMGIKQN